MAHLDSAGNEFVIFIAANDCCYYGEYDNRTYLEGWVAPPDVPEEEFMDVFIRKSS